MLVSSIPADLGASIFIALDSLYGIGMKRYYKQESTFLNAAGGDGYECISSCFGRPSGDYQSCIGCHFYATCSHWMLFDGRACPGELLWNDVLKMCDQTSTTW